MTEAERQELRDAIAERVAQHAGDNVGAIDCDYVLADAIIAILPERDTLSQGQPQ